MMSLNDDNKASNKNRKIILVTHLNPDLDACMAVWLLKRFVFPKEDYIIEFVTMGEKLPLSKVSEGDEVIYIDTSGAKYNHHDTDEYVCATSLVMEDLSLEKDLAIRRMVEYILAADHGKILDVDVNDFDLINTLEGLNELHPNHPEFVVDIVLSCLDGIYISLKQLIEAEKELGKITLFEAKWGKGAGIVSANPKIRYLAHRAGFKVFIYVDPVHGYSGFTAPGISDVDFSDVFKKLKNMEPGADWFLHSSKQLLLCGSGKAPNRKLSSLSLGQMIDLIKD